MKSVIPCPTLPTHAALGLCCQGQGRDRLHSNQLGAGILLHSLHLSLLRRRLACLAPQLIHLVRKRTTTHMKSIRNGLRALRHLVSAVEPSFQKSMVVLPKGTARAARQSKVHRVSSAMTSPSQQPTSLASSRGKLYALKTWHAKSRLRTMEPKPEARHQIKWGRHMVRPIKHSADAPKLPQRADVPTTHDAKEVGLLPQSCWAPHPQTRETTGPSSTRKRSPSQGRHNSQRHRTSTGCLQRKSLEPDFRRSFATATEGPR